jgi:hypothetical protein
MTCVIGAALGNSRPVGYHRLTDSWARRLVERAHRTGDSSWMHSRRRPSRGRWPPVRGCWPSRRISSGPQSARRLRGSNVKVITAMICDYRAMSPSWPTTLCHHDCIAQAATARAVASSCRTGATAARGANGRAPGAAGPAPSTRASARPSSFGLGACGPREAVVLEIVRRPKSR